MKILIEGEVYPVEKLEQMFDDATFYKQDGSIAKINSVDSLVFMLPKVFMEEDGHTVFGIDKEKLVNLIKDESIKHKTEYNWVRQLSVHFYNSLQEYRRRKLKTAILHDTQTFELNTNLADKEYSFLDLMLSFVNFYKKNRQQILFKHIEFISSQAKKPKWEKTIRKSLPILINGKTPIYTEISNKKKMVNTEEELITYFFSILNHLNKENDLNLKIDKSYRIIEGYAFENLCATGLSKLRKIKYRYFSDTLKRMFVLCELYFSQFDKSSIKKKKQDFLAVSNYNLVFEDMVDKLFSDVEKDYQVDGMTMDKLKNNEDGKIIDHIYDDTSLIDTSNIFYIGDSKYYKSSNAVGNVSKYKQFTYAKNVIQFNIDLLNKNGESHMKPLRYRDNLTEGYNISPNFFIRGYIDDINNYSDDSVEKSGDPVPSWHFKDRLFDRDTLFVHQYKINFLYVLKSYTTFNAGEIEKFRTNTKIKFRKHFLDFFNNSEDCGYEFFQCKLPAGQHQNFVNENFRLLNGKCFRTVDHRLLIAKSIVDNSLNDILIDFIRINKLV
jgi:hypothetical protein